MISSIYREAPDECQYIRGKQKQNLFFMAEEKLSPPIFENLIEQGYRHFGNFWFKPQCTDCQKCIGIKIAVQEYKPSKSKRRLLRKNDDLKFIVQNPVCDDEHLTLINKYHQKRTDERDWLFQNFSERQYRDSFVNNMEYSQEYQIRTDEDLLIGVGIIDCTPKVQSSVYFYYDPDFRKRGLGIWSILKEIEFAKEEGREWLHLGLWNSETPTLDYKADFPPFQLLPLLGLEEEIGELCEILGVEV